MNKIFTFVAFFTFLILCIHSIYESNASLFSSSAEKSIIAVRSIGNENIVNEQASSPSVEKEINYDAFTPDKY